jgi:hypothetical protein
MALPLFFIQIFFSNYGRKFFCDVFFQFKKWKYSILGGFLIFYFGCEFLDAEKRSVPLLFDAECFLARLDFSGYVQRTAVLAVRHTNRSLLRSPYGTL